ncbi:hypothetical protein [Acidianus manzaensis]|uniref:Uncharacterized protein n=1 Tax=Acidianus manzaensis TaxID=282676 RepID=A0A1W6K302_9CREN|nr:hypothetical protein [Acidianus manzaensis]ARM76931.1 hypothetical protein B6F84_13490 [Acidianus manzaensis]
MIDGDEEGYEQIYNQLKGRCKELNSELRPPFIKFLQQNYSITVIIVGKKDENYKRCLESMLN